MHNTWIARKIRNDNIIHVLAGLTLIIGCMTTVSLTRKFLYNALAGPFPVNLGDIDQIGNLDVERNYYVTIQAPDAVRTGYFVTRRNEPSDEYFVALVGKQYFLICVPIGHEGTEFTGVLEAEAPLFADAKLTVSNSLPFTRGKLLPFAMNVRKPLNRQGYMFAAPLVAICVAGVWLVLAGIRRTLDPQGHRYARALERHGNPDEVATAIEAESTGAARIADVCVGKHWLWRYRYTELRVMRLDDLVWAYRYDSLDKSGKTLQCCYRLFDSDGEMLQGTAGVVDVDSLLEKVHRRVPWAVIGSSLEVESLWLANRTAFIDRVLLQRGDKLGEAPTKDAASAPSPARRPEKAPESPAQAPQEANGWIGKEIRETRAALYFLGICFWIALAITLFFTRNFFYNRLLGPFPMDHQTLAAIEDVNQEATYIVTVRADKVTKTPWEYWQQGQPTIEYVVVPVGAKFLLVHCVKEDAKAEYSGILVAEVPLS